MAVVELQLARIGEIVGEVKGRVQAQVGLIPLDRGGDLVGRDLRVLEAQPSHHTELPESLLVGRVERVDGLVQVEVVGDGRVRHPKPRDRVQIGPLMVLAAYVLGPVEPKLELLVR